VAGRSSGTGQHAAWKTRVGTIAGSGQQQHGLHARAGGASAGGEAAAAQPPEGGARQG
jgi:hypothetical protein